MVYSVGVDAKAVPDGFAAESLGFCPVTRERDRQSFPPRVSFAGLTAR
jgi:hypothetical protein